MKDDKQYNLSEVSTTKVCVPLRGFSQQPAARRDAFLKELARELIHRGREN